MLLKRMLVSGEWRAECGGTLTLVSDGLIIESGLFDEMLLVNATPVVTPGATLAESFVHAGLGLGPVLNYGTERERTFGASHDGR